MLGTMMVQCRRTADYRRSCAQYRLSDVRFDHENGSPFEKDLEDDRAMTLPGLILEE